MELPRKRVPASARDRLCAPCDPFTTVEQLAHERVRLELLQQVVRRQLDVPVVEPDDEPERNQLLAHRVEPRAAELPVPRRLAERPAERVHDLVERLRDAPDLLDAELPDLRLASVKPEPVERGKREVTRRALGEHRHPRDDVRPRARSCRAPLPLCPGPCHPSGPRPRGRGRRAAGRPQSRGAETLPPPPLARTDTGSAGRSRRSSCRGFGASAAVESAARASSSARRRPRPGPPRRSERPRAAPAGP